MALKNPEKAVELIVDAMRKQAEEAHTNKAEIDISGGIDSAVVTALVCKAFGPENVIGVYSSINSSEESHRRAQLVAKKFGCKFVELDLTGPYSMIVAYMRAAFKHAGLDFPDEEDPKNATIFGSLRSCLRAPVGRFANRCFGGGIRQGTGNRDEDELLRFYQKGGDGEVDCNWIAGLFKGEVWQLAEYLEVPREVIDAKPTPDLWGKGDDHNDEDELEDLTGVKLTYTRPDGPIGTIEWVTRCNDSHGVITGHNAERDDIVDNFTEEQWNIIQAVRKMEKATRHKASPPPSLSRDILIKNGAVN